MKFYVEAFHLVGPADDLGFRKETHKCGSDGTWIISDLKTVRGVLNRVKSVKWAKDVTRIDICTYTNFFDDKTRRVLKTMDAHCFTKVE